MIEWTIESHKVYTDPFNDVNVDVIFSHGNEGWRVPTFWRGGNRWTVRFALPAPGEYQYHLESTDTANGDLNGHEGRITVAVYSGSDFLYRHGPIRISANQRYFEHADGTPFYWLGDTWWMGLSERLSWIDFQKLTEDRKAKGFTVIQTVAGLVPPFEETCPEDPGCRNEGGPVWEPGFARVNPKYFDAADRRIQHLVNSGMAPAIVGAWNGVLSQMGVAKMKQHWRYIVARYGAYPVFWIVGGEVVDPPVDLAPNSPSYKVTLPGGWTEVAQYLKSIDPYHHPITAHEGMADPPLQDESVTDFEMFQPSHYSWASIATEVAQLNLHYAQTNLTKPLVIGEIGYENLGEQHYPDFQRAAFWLAMLNGAAGHTYGANGVWESYSSDKPLHRRRWSFMSWEEGMSLPGSYQLGINAKLLQQYRWWKFAPHPEWVTPRGTTLLEPRERTTGLDLGTMDDFIQSGQWRAPDEGEFPKGEWQARRGTFRLPYAAGVPGEVRMIYMPYFGLLPRTPATVLGLEMGVLYHAYLWDPSLGIKFDLGAVEKPAPGKVLVQDSFKHLRKSRWKDYVGSPHHASDSRLTAVDDVLSIRKGAGSVDAVASVKLLSNSDAALILRFQDPDNYLAAVYSAADKVIYIIEHTRGRDGPVLGRTPINALDTPLRLTAEVRGTAAAFAVKDGQQTYSSPIVNIEQATGDRAGIQYHPESGPFTSHGFTDFEVRQSPALVKDAMLNKTLRDANGVPRGELKGSPVPIEGSVGRGGWDDFGKNKLILLNAYRPEELPYGRDWVLILETNNASVMH